MLQTSGTLEQMDFMEDEEIRRRLGLHEPIDQIHWPTNRDESKRRFEQRLFRSNSPFLQMSTIFTSLYFLLVFTSLLDYITVCTAAPLQGSKLVPRNLPIAFLNLPDPEDALLPDTQRHRFATVSQLLRCF